MSVVGDRKTWKSAVFIWLKPLLDKQEKVTIKDLNMLNGTPSIYLDEIDVAVHYMSKLTCTDH